MAKLLKTPGPEAQKALVREVNRLAEGHVQETELRNKMAIIDAAYARYRQRVQDIMDNGVDNPDRDALQAELQDELSELRESFVSIDIPVVASQVDTFVGYASELYLSGHPIFGIVSDNKNKKVASYIENLIEKHSRISKYARDLQMFFRDCGKYNYGALLVDWDIKRHYVRNDQAEVVGNEAPVLSEEVIGYNSIRRLDPYNTFADSTVLPGDVAEHGDHAGFIELMTMQKLRRTIQRLEKKALGHVMNKHLALKSKATNNHYQMPPKVSDYISANKEFDWDSYLSAVTSAKTEVNYGGRFEVATMYFRAEAADFKMADNPGEHIYKVMIVNGLHVVYVERVYSAFDTLPMLFGQPVEDGLGLQTQSIAEAAEPMQKAASAMVNIRFHASRRALADRALYNDNMIDSDDINNPSASAKIPVKTNTLAQQNLAEAYYSIPYNDTATNNILNEAISISDWTSDLNGFNRASQGRFTRGNRTQTEFSDIQSNSEQRQRLHVLVLENQVFIPLKSILMLNILRHSTGEVVQAVDTGEEISVDLNELTKAVLEFKVADGYLPKSKLANTDLLTALMTQVATNQVLAASFGDRLPEMFAHLATLGGIPGLDQYVPRGATNVADSTTAAGTDAAGNTGTVGDAT